MDGGVVISTPGAPVSKNIVKIDIPSIWYTNHLQESLLSTRLAIPVVAQVYLI